MAEEKTSPSSPSPGDGDAEEVVDAASRADDGSAAAREKWFNEMRGWIMTLATLVASVTYQAGLSPPGGFLESRGEGQEDDGVPVLQSINPIRYNVFFYSNTTAFLTSLAIIILLMNRTVYVAEAKVVALEIIVVLDMVGLMAAYWAGSTRRGQTDMFTLVLTAAVLVVIYAVYAVQLVPKLCRLVAGELCRRRALPRDEALEPNHVVDVDCDTRAPLLGDVGRSMSSELRCRDSRRLPRISETEQSHVMSP